ncbi:MAG: hypothetical protein K9G62_08770 [Alphaproteobacteria bacterium]|nr:hypothetical protein [Alphaproteobacteria bacterium]
MTIHLIQPFSVHGRYDDFDTRQVKRALSRLGYYTPDTRAGMDENRRPALFAALNAFRRDKGLPESDYLMPFDSTVYALNAAVEKHGNASRYVWRTRKDDRVRDEHAAREGRIFVWGFPPEGGHPGEDFNCRCWPEEIAEHKPERDRDRVCLDLMNAHNEVDAKIQEIQKQLSEIRNEISSREEKIQALEVQIRDLAVASVPNPVTGKSKLGPLGAIADVIDAAAKIYQIEQLREELNRLEKELKEFERQEAQLEREMAAAHKRRKDIEEQSRVLCQNFYG